METMGDFLVNGIAQEHPMLSVQSAEMVGPRWERGETRAANALLDDITPKLGREMCNSVVIRNRTNNNNINTIYQKQYLSIAI